MTTRKLSWQSLKLILTVCFVLVMAAAVLLGVFATSNDAYAATTDTEDVILTGTAKVKVGNEVRTNKTVTKSELANVTVEVAYTIKVTNASNAVYALYVELPFDNMYNLTPEKITLNSDIFGGVGTKTNGGQASYDKIAVVWEAGDANKFSSEAEVNLLTATYTISSEAANFVAGSHAFALENVDALAWWEKTESAAGKTFPSRSCKVDASATEIKVVNDRSITAVDTASFVYSGKPIKVAQNPTDAFTNEEPNERLNDASKFNYITYSYTDAAASDTVNCTWVAETGSLNASNEPQDVGTYKLTITVEGTDTYAAASKEVTVTITPFDLTDYYTAADVTAAAHDYTGEEQVWDPETEGDITFADTDLTGAGAPYATVTAAKIKDGCEKIQPGKTTLVVELTVSDTKNFNFGTGKTAIEVEVEATIKSLKNEWVTAPADITAIYGENYSAKLNAAAKEDTVVKYAFWTEPDNNFSADGKPTANATWVTAEEGVLPTETSSLPRNAGTYGMRVTGTLAGHDTLTADKKLVISSREIAVGGATIDASWFTGKTLTSVPYKAAAYDTTTFVLALPDSTVDGVDTEFITDAQKLAVIIDVAHAAADGVSEYKYANTYNVKTTLSLKDGVKNYTFKSGATSVSGTTTVKITKIAIEVEFTTAKSVTFDGEAWTDDRLGLVKGTNYNLKDDQGILEGDTAKLTFSIVGDEKTAAKKYDLTASCTDTTNYTVTVVAGSGKEKFIVTNASVEVPSAEVLTRVYNGKRELPALPDGAKYTFSYTAGSEIPKDVGSYKLTATLPANYVWSDDRTGAIELDWTITKLTKTIKVTYDTAANEFTYGDPLNTSIFKIEGVTGNEIQVGDDKYTMVFYIVERASEEANGLQLDAGTYHVAAKCETNNITWDCKDGNTAALTVAPFEIDPSAINLAFADSANQVKDYTGSILNWTVGTAGTEIIASVNTGVSDLFPKIGDEARKTLANLVTFAPSETGTDNQFKYANVYRKLGASEDNYTYYKIGVQEDGTDGNGADFKYMYKIVYTLADTNNYKFTEGETAGNEIEVKIAQAITAFKSGSPDVTMTPGEGSRPSIVAETNFGQSTLKIQYGEFVNAATPVSYQDYTDSSPIDTSKDYKFKFIIAKTRNYTELIQGDVSLQWHAAAVARPVINYTKADGTTETITLNAGNNFLDSRTETYNAKDFFTKYSIGNEGDKGYKIEYSSDDGATWTTDTIEIKNVGNYHIKVSLLPNYKWTGDEGVNNAPMTCKLDITQAALTLTLKDIEVNYPVTALPTAYNIENSALQGEDKLPDNLNTSTYIDYMGATVTTLKPGDKGSIGWNETAVKNALPNYNITLESKGTEEGTTAALKVKAVDITITGSAVTGNKYEATYDGAEHTIYTLENVEFSDPGGAGVEIYYTIGEDTTKHSIRPQNGSFNGLTGGYEIKVKDVADSGAKTYKIHVQPNDNNIPGKTETVTVTVNISAYEIKVTPQLSLTGGTLKYHGFVEGNVTLGIASATTSAGAALPDHAKKYLDGTGAAGSYANLLVGIKNSAGTELTKAQFADADAGDYTLTCKAQTESANYTLTVETVTKKIAKGTPTITFTTAPTKVTYGTIADGSFVATVGGSSVGITYTFKAPDDDPDVVASWKSLNDATFKVGANWTVRANYAESTNYAAATEDHTFEITKVQVDIVLNKIGDYAYDADLWSAVAIHHQYNGLAFEFDMSKLSAASATTVVGKKSVALDALGKITFGVTYEGGETVGSAPTNVLGHEEGMPQGYYTMTFTATIAEGSIYEINSVTPCDDQNHDWVLYIWPAFVKITANGYETTAGGDKVQQSDLTYTLESAYINLESFELDAYTEVTDDELKTRFADELNINLTSAAIGKNTVMKATISVSCDATAENNGDNYEVKIDSVPKYVEIKAATNEIEWTTPLEAKYNYLKTISYAAKGKGQNAATFAFTSQDGTKSYTKAQVDADPSLLTVGTWTITASVAAETGENAIYGAASDSKTFKIEKATVAAIVESGITYAADVATWTAVTQTTDGATIPTDKYTIKYKVGLTGSTEEATLTTDNSFTAEGKGTFFVEVIVVNKDGSDTANFQASEPKDLAVVYEVKFTNTDGPANAQNLPATLYRFNKQTVVEPAKPTSATHTFLQWNNGDAKYTFGTKVTSDLTLTAVWEANTVKLTWKMDDGTLIGDPVDAVIGDPIKNYAPKNVTKAPSDGYTYEFVGWNPSFGENTVTEAATYTAVFNKYANAGTVQFFIKYPGAANYTEETASQLTNVSVGTALTYPTKTTPYFVLSDWHKQDGSKAPAKMPVVSDGTLKLYAELVLNIGQGDVNGDGKINADDIGRYRQYIVGGYGLDVVEQGEHGSVAAAIYARTNSGTIDEDKIFFACLANVYGSDNKLDIRDVAEMRMAIVGGYGVDIFDMQGNPTGQEIKEGTNKYTLHYYNVNGWDKVHAYVWNEGDTLNNSFPGAEMKDDDGDGWWTVQVPTYAKNVIFNKGVGGTGNETATIPLDPNAMKDNVMYHNGYNWVNKNLWQNGTDGKYTDVYYYNEKGWTDVAAYSYSDNVAAVDLEMTRVEGTTHWYKCTLSTRYTTVIFHNKGTWDDGQSATYTLESGSSYYGLSRQFSSMDLGLYVMVGNNAYAVTDINPTNSSQYMITLNIPADQTGAVKVLIDGKVVESSKIGGTISAGTHTFYLKLTVESDGYDVWVG